MADKILQYLLDLVTSLGGWSYLIIFGAAALECAAFAGLLVPGESLVLASGFLAHRGILRLQLILPAVALGAIAGDNIGYLLGRRLGRDWLLRKGSRFGLRRKRQGPKAVFVGRFIGFARALIPFVAGASRMSYRKFFLYDALGAIIWTVVFVTLGYMLGASWQLAETWISRTGLILGSLILVAALLAARHRRRRSARV